MWLLHDVLQYIRAGIFIFCVIMSKSATTRNTRGRKKKTNVTPKEPVDESDNCIICFEEVSCRGKLSVCDHWFCFNCIYEWSKVNSMNNKPNKLTKYKQFIQLVVVCPNCCCFFSEY